MIAMSDVTSELPLRLNLPKLDAHPGVITDRVLSLP